MNGWMKRGWPPEWCDAGEPPRAEPGGAPGGGGGGLGACACATDAIGSGGVARAVASLRSLFAENLLEVGE